MTVNCVRCGADLYAGQSGWCSKRCREADLAERRPGRKKTPTRNTWERLLP